MKKAIFILILTLLCWQVIFGQSVNVTFKANVATVPDTMGTKGMVQMRGTLITPAGRTADDASTDTLSPGVILAWNAQSTMNFENVDGDYWEGTFAIPTGSQINYKFYTNASHDSVYPGASWEHQGWESGIEKLPYGYGNDRGLDLSTFVGTDTTLPLEFVNGILGIAPQFFRPYTESDSMDIWFRVNMQTYEEFNDQTQVIGVRGGPVGGVIPLGDLSWDRTLTLSQERNHANTGSAQYGGRFFWSGHCRIPTDGVDAGDKIEYTFVVMSKNDPEDAVPLYEEDVDNRVFTISAEKPDTTLYWVWFEDKKPAVIEHNESVKMTFIVDMAQAIQNKGFTYGDTVEVRVGYYNTSRLLVTIPLKRQSITSIYKGSGYVWTTSGMNVDYQYYAYKHGRDYREVYYNFEYEGDATGEAERRQVLVEGTKMEIADTLASQVEPRRMPFFRNTSTIAQDVLVTFTCDVRPAYYQILLGGDILEDIQGTLNITNPDDVIALGVAMNGPATGSWSNDIGPDWGAHLMTLDNKKMYDDGTHGDVTAGDSIYSIQFHYYPDSLDEVGQEFKFGIGGGDNEGGYGNNHIANIDDSQPTATIHSQFGSIDPVFYSAWDYDRQDLTDVEDQTTHSVYKFSLRQNYPNPFNPITTIEYSLATPEKVSIQVFDILGIKVHTLVNQKQNSGLYSVQWNGRNENGQLVSSGLYFIRIEAGDFVKTRKMMFLK